MPDSTTYPSASYLELKKGNKRLVKNLIVSLLHAQQRARKYQNENRKTKEIDRARIKKTIN